ncbi:hypothetical protein [Microaceticoccus formicicus]|uniref:hypothetical protein n=1 Tax=Microaceticoccus formicicus TaxID=3118105 RepID=UPI003CD04783|nr:hypothetical protein VZL98_07295 [Peptoniphilaceae bacterium AMB_02]
MRVIIKDLKETVLSLRFFLALIFFIAFRYIVTSQEINFLSQGKGLFHMIHGSVIYLSKLYLFGPLLPLSMGITLIPYIDSFINDYKTGFLKYRVVRTGTDKYIASKISTTILSTFLITTIGYSFLTILFSFLLPFASNNPVLHTWGLYSLSETKPEIFITLVIILYALNFSFWALYSLYLTTLTNNKYLSLIGSVFTMLFLNDVFIKLFKVRFDDLMLGSLKIVNPLFSFLASLVITLVLITLLATLISSNIKKVVKE